MTRRRWLAWALLACTVASMLTAAFMPDEDWPLVAIAALGFVFTLLGSLGTLVVNRRPENTIGWILVALGLFGALGFAATQYANRTIVDLPGSLPGGVIAAWLQSWLWSPLLAAFPLLVTLFPTGRPVSRRWRAVVYAAVALMAIAVVTAAFRPGPFDTFPSVDNPLGIGLFGRAGDLTDVFWFPLVGATFGAAIVSMIVRFRRSRGPERQQLKWFVYAVVTAALLVLTSPLLMLTVPKGEGTFLRFVLAFTPAIIGFLLIPIAIALSILRYRLYDIDRLITRTATYATLSACLVAVYGLVTLSATAVVGRSGETPEYAVAIATLVAAALFRPLRRRVQRVVDRRFNRTRYDAEQTISMFAGRVRRQVDLDALGGELRGVVQATMHPSHVSLWLRPTVTVTERSERRLRA
jgi:hypothetical protein